MVMNRSATVGCSLITLLIAALFGGKVHAQATCVGDCNGDAQVTVDEIVHTVGLVLDGTAASCTTADDNHDGSITIDEVITSVTNALLGCRRLLPPGADLTRMYPGPRIAAGGGPVALVADDLDGDAAIDLAALNDISGTLSLMLQDDTGGFSARLLPIPAGSAALVAARLDGDALPDLVGAAESSDYVWVARSTKAFTVFAPFAVGTRPASLAAGDLNGDLFDDVVVGNRESADVSVLLNDSTGSFDAQRRFGAGGAVHAITVGDLDRDRKLDVVAATETQSIVVLYGDGTGSLGPSTAIEVSIRPAAILAGDLNDDERIDFIVLEAPPIDAASRIAIVLGAGERTFASPLYVDSGIAAAGMTVADIDDDARLDVVIGGVGSVSVMYGRGNGTFDGPVSFVVSREANAVAVADFDADGNADVGYADSEADALSILWGLGGRRLAAERTIEVDGLGVVRVLSGDLDGDGRIDLVSVNELSDDVSVLLNKGDGEFAPPTHIEADQNLAAAAVGDLDGGGQLDLVTASASIACSDCLTVFEGTGGGTFEEHRRLVTAAGVLALAVVDIDGDAAGDIVSLDRAGLSAFAGLGDWSFAPELRIEAGTEPRSFEVGDLNGDAYTDLAVANSGSRDVSVLLAAGTGGFEPQRRLPLAFAPVRIRVADLNADGTADIVVRGSDRLSVLLGFGGGAFAPEWPLITTASGGAFDLADVNDDGWLDFVTLAQGTAIYPGLPDLRFGAPQLFAGNPLAIDLRALDINGDEVADIVTANASLQGSISVIPGRRH
jgi:hypothetical protein